MEIIRNNKGQFVKGQKTRKNIPILGKTYGSFTIISEDVKIKDNKVCFNVKCSCGKEQFIRAYFLEIGRQDCCKSCSQRRAVYANPGRGNYLGKGHDGIENFTKTTYSYFKRNAKRRNIEWSKELTIEYLYNLLLKQNKKCALSNLDIDLTESRKNSNINFELMTASIDRIDSKLGYIPTNIQWVHKDINRMKWAFDQNHFINLCKLIINHANQQGS